MRKTLLSLFLFAACMATAWAGEVVFDFTKPTELNPSVTPAETPSAGVDMDQATFTNGSVSILMDKGGASTPVRIWTTTAGTTELRLYKGSTFTVSAGEAIKSIVLQGKKIANNNITPDAGTYADGTWTGSGSEKSVTFSVSGTLNITSITVTCDGEGGGTVDPTPDPTPDPDQPATLWSEAFSANKGNFTIENKTMPEAATYIWNYDTRGYMKASAYINKVNYEAESWLISPVLDMTKATDPVLTFSHTGKFFGNMTEEATLMAKAENGEWTALPIDQWFSGNDWTFVTATVSLKQFEGKKAQFAFVYKSTTEASGSWEVKDLAISGKGEITEQAEEKPVPAFTTIAELKAAATVEETAVQYSFTDLLVTGVKGTSLYVTDGTEGLLFYGGDNSKFKAGDKISGKISGGLKLYNGLTEVNAPDYTGATVASSGNAVEPKTLTIAEIGTGDGLKTYENLLVKIENVSFAAEALANKNITIVENDTDNEITLRDNFGVLGDFIFDTTKSYNVTAFVACYNSTPQLYPMDAADIEMLTNLAPAETAWENDTVAILAGEAWTVNNTLKTLSDATPTYTSSNEAVATVDGEGNITVTGYGHAVITAETAETEAYLAGKSSFDLFVIEGEGTLEKPYAPADVQYLLGKAVSGKVWVKGTIIGCYDNNKLTTNLAEAVASNIAIGSEECNIPVQLPSKSEVREALNLQSVPGNMGREVWVYGDIEKYFGMAGVKNTTDYSLDGETTLTGISGVEAANGKAARIYSIDGRRLSRLAKGINIVNGKKVILK